jgi:bile acid:Na+ symporter, BASS family
MIDQVQLNFSPASLMALNVILAFILFGIALDLKISDFKRVAAMPKEVAVGLSGQIILLPLLTVALIYFYNPIPSMALGMIMVASCPGGNLSNFMTHYAKGNAALSVTLTTLATLLAIIATPFNFWFWGNIIPSTSPIMKSIDLPVWGMVFQVFLLIGIPLSAGLAVSHKFPHIAKKAKKPMKFLSLIFFGLFVMLALLGNWQYFKQYIHIIFLIVLMHNGIAFLGAYGWASIFGIRKAEKRAITLEVGLQNSGLALILIFNFFGGMGGMAIIAAFWGMWHIISGLILASYWSKR